jgi:hypothetical protein
MPQAQNIFTLEPEQRKSITFAAAETSRYLEHSFDSPGDNSSLFDPGQAYLTITTNDTTTQIKTSVDALSAQNSNAETAMYKLASGLRSASGGTVCGNRTFYGIR